MRFECQRSEVILQSLLQMLPLELNKDKSAFCIIGVFFFVPF